MTQEALKLALECAERCEAIDGMYSWSATITAIKEALAQTQEPVVKLKTSNMLLRCHRCGCSDKLNIQIEYTYPPQRIWVGLTDEEKSELWEISRAALPRYATYASLVEAKLKEKNT